MLVFSLQRLKEWAPFRIDALGLVTILGADEVNRAVGRLVHSSVSEYLPLLGAFAIAGNHFSRPLPGFTLYNITDGIMATDLSGWFARWILHQDFSWNKSVLIWGFRNEARSTFDSEARAISIGIIVNGSLLTASLLLDDWFGLVNALSMIVSVFVRWYLVKQNRDAIDKQIGMIARGSENLMTEIVKIFCLLSDGRAVTLYAPRAIVLCFLTTPRIGRRRVYKTVRACGWLAFALHVICIGQATLFTQILTVTIMLVSTVMSTAGIGCNEDHLCGQFNIFRFDYSNVPDRRPPAYVYLNLSAEEENSMLAWSMFPQRSNKRWWSQYNSLCSLRDKAAWEDLTRAMSDVVE